MPSTESFLLELAIDFLEPISHSRTPYTLSRLAVLPNRTTMPVLQILALRKYKTIPEGTFPFWLDGNYLNETFSNIELAPIPLEKPERRKLNIPGGPDYRKRWREENRERVRRYAREASARRALFSLIETARALSVEGCSGSQEEKG